MANEITYSVSLQAVKDNISVKREHLNKTVTLTGDAYSSQTQSIPTTAAGTAVTVAAAVGTPGFSVFVNQDKTNYVELGVENAGTFYPFATLKAGEACLMRLTDTTFHAVANTAAVILESFIIED